MTAAIQAPTKHVFVCIAQRPPTAGDSCGANGSRMLLDQLGLKLAQADLADRVRLNGCTCLGPCGAGVNLVVYPDGVFYLRVRTEDLDEIVREHLLGGRPVERLLAAAPQG